MALHDYIFSIDADEALSIELINAIKCLKYNTLDAEAFEVKRLNNYCGKWIKHTGWYPDIKLRLWKKEAASWQGDIHETIVFNSKKQTKILEGNLLHYTYYTIDEHILQTNKFSALSAKMLFENRKKVNLAQIILKPFWKFLQIYFFKAGWRDGYFGFVISIISAHETFLRYTKLKQLIELENAKIN